MVSIPLYLVWKGTQPGDFFPPLGHFVLSCFSPGRRLLAVLATERTPFVVSPFVTGRLSIRDYKRPFRDTRLVVCKWCVCARSGRLYVSCLPLRNTCVLMFLYLPSFSESGWCHSGVLVPWCTIIQTYRLWVMLMLPLVIVFRGFELWWFCDGYVYLMWVLATATLS